MTAGDTVTVFLYSFNARRCPFQTNVNRTFCPAQPIETNETFGDVDVLDVGFDRGFLGHTNTMCGPPVF